MFRAGLAYLAGCDAAGLTVAEQAGLLRELQRGQAQLTAAQARILGAFEAQAGYEADGHGGPRPWLVWQTRITRGAAAGAIGWSRRLARHPLADRAMAAGAITDSWARKVCDWSDLLPEDRRADADQILLTAAAGGADLGDLAGLAEEMYRRCAPPDADDGDDGFAGRSVRLDRHFQGAGKLDGNLTPECAAAVQAVLDSLGKRAGPEDDRTQGQRDHDALEEVCRGFIAGGGLPDVAGQPVQVQLYTTLDQQLGLAASACAGSASGGRAPDGRDGAADDLPEWLTRPAPPGLDGEPGWLTGPAAEAYSCDAKIAPIVCGHLDRDALAAMVHDRLHPDDEPDHDPGCTCSGRARRARSRAGQADAGNGRLADALTRYAIGVLSGPSGLAAFLRSGLTGNFTRSASLPLDVGAATDEVPPHLRRAVIKRDRHCAFPGCDRRPVRCQVHHIIPRSAGGPTRLDNLLLLCGFHHLIAIHRWGWTITLHADGTTTAVSPDRTKILRSHGPPGHDPPGHDPPATVA
jgi:uncharacterized protein DUF222/HNH endonuclease